MTMLIKAHKLINQKLPKMSKILLKSSSSNWSKVGVSTCGLLQDKPLQSPHAGIHFRPFLWHLHSMVPQVLREAVLHLHRITFNKLSGAAGRSHRIGTNTLLTRFHPQFFGLRHLISKFIARETSKCTRSEWKYVALSVGGSFSGFNWSLVAVAWFHSTYRSLVKESFDFPLYLEQDKIVRSSQK